MKSEPTQYINAGNQKNYFKEMEFFVIFFFFFIKSLKIFTMDSQTIC